MTRDSKKIKPKISGVINTSLYDTIEKMLKDFKESRKTLKGWIRKLTDDAENFDRKIRAMQELRRQEFDIIAMLSKLKPEKDEEDKMCEEEILHWKKMNELIDRRKKEFDDEKASREARQSLEQNE